MTPLRAARLAAALLVAVVLVASATYLLLYLYRWEWNRAIVSGLFFLAALTTTCTALVLAAIRRLDQRLDDLAADATTTTRATRQLIGATSAAAARRRFAWLEESSSRLSVFIPVLLGAGALLSGVTFVLERLAGALAGPVVDQRSARLLAPDLPLGPLRQLERTAARHAAAPRRDPLLVADPAELPPPGPHHRAATAIATVLVVAIVVTGIVVLRTASQSRPEPGTTDGATLLVLEIDQRRTPRDVEQVAEALWVACRARLAPATELTSVRVLAPRTVELVVDQGMGPLRERRFVGCLQDAVIDLVDARVLRTEQLDGATR